MKRSILIYLLIIVTLLIGEKVTFSAVKHTVHGRVLAVSSGIVLHAGFASNAEVTITNLNTHVVWTTQADGDGKYEINNITHPGSYKIEAEGTYTAFVGIFPFPALFTGQDFFTIPVGQTTTGIDVYITCGSGIQFN